MKLKTLERLRRRFEKLPLHHIDTSVAIETEKTEDGRYCRKYLQLIGYKYRGRFSSIVMSEFMLRLLKNKDYDVRFSFLQILDYLEEKRKVDIYTPVRIGNLIEELTDLDTRLKPHDIMIIACAIEDGATYFVTLDNKLIHHKSIESRYGLKILHPKELIQF